MTSPAARLLSRTISAIAGMVMFAVAAMCPQAASASPGLNLLPQEKYAAIVVDANSGEVMYARRADEQRYPASITKIMTLYLTFEALSTGRLSTGDRISVSAHATNQAPSKLGLRVGESLTVDQAIRAIAVKSANDIAVAMAEHIGGSESKFAALMTLRAQELGMTNTRFVNASGLPDTRQLTSARDIAILSRAVMRDYPQYYAYFSTKSFDWRGHEILNHNGLLRKMPGVDGLKTGYTNAAGFNLAASAVRNGKRLIAVVLGGSSTAARDENVEDLLNGGFEVFAKRAQGQKITLASTLHEAPDAAGGPIQRGSSEMGSGDQAGLKIVVGDNAPLPSALRATAVAERTAPRGERAAPAKAQQQACAAPARRHGRHHRAATSCTRLRDTETASSGKGARTSGKYAIQVGSFTSMTEAKAHLAKMKTRYSAVLAASGQVEKAGKNRFRARYAGMSQGEARTACRALSSRGEHCMVVGGS
jgi:D-alanyl-D-alanine carboxypeptidase (penicillin-binding protein 5/6)